MKIPFNCKLFRNLPVLQLLVVPTWYCRRWLTSMPTSILPIHMALWVETRVKWKQSCTQNLDLKSSSHKLVDLCGGGNWFVTNFDPSQFPIYGKYCGVVGINKVHSTMFGIFHDLIGSCQCWLKLQLFWYRFENSIYFIIISSKKMRTQQTQKNENIEWKICISGKLLTMVTIN